jgi:threonyl-tRNA synthetase
MSMSPLEELRHSASHILATALLRIFPDAKLDIGPPTDSGFYYDVDLDHKLTNDDLTKLEVEMKKVADENQPFLRKEVSREEAIEIIRSRGQERYKLGRLADIPEGEKISFYQNGEFMDLCAGTHVRYSSKLKAFKLLSIAGAYHRGDEKNKQLQRIYGTAFPTKEELAQHLDRLEQAKARDHRKLGKDLKLFVIDEDVGQGLILWTPNGSIIRQELQSFIGEELRKQGYSQVFTPHIGKLELYKTSGHFPYYKESQFTPVVENETLTRIVREGCSCADMVARLDAVSSKLRQTVNERSGREIIPENRVLDAEKLLDGFMLKPMNCPHHIKIFRVPASTPTATCRCAWPSSAPCTAGNSRRAERHDPRPRLHPGRCPSLLHRAQVGGRGVRLPCRSSKMVLTTLGMRTTACASACATRTAPSTPATQPIGTRPRPPAARPPRPSASPSREEPGEAAFYGPKIDFRRQGRHRPRVAARHRAGGLQPAPAVRPGLHRRRTISGTGRS